MLQPLKRKKLYEEIVEQLLVLIKSGELKPGDRLPPERNLAEELKVSRSAIREALRAMESMGYTESKVGGGTFIRELTLESLMNPLSVVLSRDEKVIEDIIEVRLILETKCAALAAKRITQDQLAGLEAALDEMARDIQAGGLGCEADEKFHLLLAQATENMALCTIFNMCRELLSKTIEAVFRQPNQPITALEEHLKILEAIKKKDGKTAGEMMELHLRQAHRRICRTDIDMGDFEYSDH